MYKYHEQFLKILFIEDESDGTVEKQQMDQGCLKNG